MTGYQSKKLMAQSRESDLVKRLRAEDPECGLRHSLAMEVADYVENMEFMIEWMENMDPKLVESARIVLWEKKND